MKNCNSGSSLLVFFICFLGFAIGDDTFCHVEGHCNQPFYYETNVEDYNDCLATCKKEFDCNHFSYIEANTFNCLLFNLDICNLEDYLCEDKTCYSGTSTCHFSNEVDPNIPESGCGLDGACIGLLIGEDTLDTEQECIELCGSTNGCYWSTFAEGSGECKLLQTCTSFDESVNVTSSYKKCARGNWSTILNRNI